MLKFQSSPNPTIGVEIELQLIDTKTFGLNNIASKVLAEVNNKFSNKIRIEFIQSMIEINTSVCATVEEVEKDIKETLTYLDEILTNYKSMFSCTSLHPFSQGKKQIISDNSRYKRIMNDLQIVGKRFISQGLHVHIGIEDKEKAIQVNNALRIYLPSLLALSASSPFFEGEDTGLHSYRTKLFESLPLAGMPDYLNNWNHFVQLTERLQKAEIIKSVKDLWWDVRPHPGFGTIEIRICDIPLNLSKILALVALIQALVVTLNQKNLHSETHIQILESNKWQAARYGLTGVFVDPITIQQMSMKESIENLCNFIEPASRSLKSSKYIRVVEEILSEGTGSTKQRRLYKNSGSFEYMIKYLKENFYQ